MGTHRGVMVYCAVACFFTCLSVSYSAVCNDAQKCVDEITKLPSTMACVDKLENVTELKKCVQDNVADCDSNTKTRITTELEDALEIFTTNCSTADCNDVITKFSHLTDSCLLPGDTLEKVLAAAAYNWNYNKYNESIISDVKNMVSCIEGTVNRCNLLRQAYGKLYQKYPQLPLIQQTLNIYKEVNGDDPSSPIISDCDDDPDKILKDIISSCPLNVPDSNWLIINYCVPMQEQIDCALRWQNTCPVSVTKFLKPFMDSYGVTHRIFCNNITIHGFLLRSLNEDCQTDAYQQIYRSCWQPIMKEFALNPNTNNEAIDAYSLDTFFRLPTFKDKNLCGIFRDRSRYRIEELRSCTRNKKGECPLVFPTHGSRPEIPDGLLYDPDLYKQLLTGPTPFNEYGALLLQYLRDHFCYPDCKEYDTLNTDYKTNCREKLRQQVTEFKSDTTTESCKSLSQQVTCASNVTIKCPLFQYQTSQLLNEKAIKSALDVCNIKQPDLLPDDYFAYTTTQKPVRTTTYWASSGVTGVSRTHIISSHPAVVILLAAASIVFML